MKSLVIAEDIVPIGEFKTHASAVVRRLRANGRPVVVTQSGKPAAVLLSPEEFDRLTERARFLGAIDEGLADLDADRSTPHARVVDEMKRRASARRR